MTPVEESRLARREALINGVLTLATLFGIATLGWSIGQIIRALGW